MQEGHLNGQIHNYMWLVDVVNASFKQIFIV